MSRIKEWFMEFCAVPEATPRLEYSLAASVALPAFLFAFGTWLITRVDVSGFYGPIVAAVQGPLEIVVTALSMILFVRIASKVADDYRKARARLCGY